MLNCCSVAAQACKSVHADTKQLLESGLKSQYEEKFRTHAEELTSLRASLEDKTAEVTASVMEAATAKVNLFKRDRDAFENTKDIYVIEGEEKDGAKSAKGRVKKAKAKECA